MDKLQNYMIDVLVNEMEELKGENLEMYPSDLPFRLFEPQVKILLCLANTLLYASETFSELEGLTEFTDELLDTMIKELKE